MRIALSYEVHFTFWTNGLTHGRLYLLLCSVYAHYLLIAVQINVQTNRFVRWPWRRKLSCFVEEVPKQSDDSNIYSLRSKSQQRLNCEKLTIRHDLIYMPLSWQASEHARWTFTISECLLFATVAVNQYNDNKWRPSPGTCSTMLSPAYGFS